MTDSARSGDRPQNADLSRLMAAVARIGFFLPTGDDHLLVVLKGHLLLEEQLDCILRDIAEQPSELPARLNYATKLALAKAIRYRGAAPEIWDVAKQLNTFRNGYAHHLKDQLFDREVDKWVVPTCQRFIELGLLAGVDQLTGVEALRHIILASYIMLTRVHDLGVDVPAGWRSPAC